jgi:hypothetical protein
MKIILSLGIIFIFNILILSCNAERSIGDIDVIGVDSTEFPNIKLSIFVDNPCGELGSLKTEDFFVNEMGRQVRDMKASFRQPSLDFVVVFDDTGSMGDEIDAMKYKVQELIDQINEAHIDARYSLITFKDTTSIRTGWTYSSDSFIVLNLTKYT